MENLSWSLAKNALTDNQKLRALRAFLIVSTVSHGHAVSKKTIYEAYNDFSVSIKTARQDLTALLNIWNQDGYQTVLAYESSDGVVLRSVFKVVNDLKMTMNGAIEVKSHMLQDIYTFKRYLYEAVAFSHNRESDAGVTISHTAVQKLTGLSRSTQIRYNKRQGVVARPNYAEIDVPLPELRRRYGVRVRGYTVQIRNTYFSNTPELSRRMRWGGSAGVPANNLKRFYPERGDRVLRQTFEEPPAAHIIKHLIQHVDIDIRVGAVTMPTGEIAGAFIKIPRGADYRDSLNYLHALRNVPRQIRRET